MHFPFAVLEESSIVSNPVTEKIESLRQSRSELNLIVSSADHGAIYRCRSFAAPTMIRPVDSDQSIVFNVTCEYQIWQIFPLSPSLNKVLSLNPNIQCRHSRENIFQNTLPTSDTMYRVQFLCQNDRYDVLFFL